MKTLYFDSSYLFRIYSREAGHESVKSLLEEAPRIASAWHARAEFAAILLRKRRESSDPEDFLESLHSQFLQDCRQDLVTLLPLSEGVMERLESVLRTAPPDTFLRSADVLHLACAKEHGFTEVYSNDRHFLAAAPLFDLHGVDITPA